MEEHSTITTNQDIDREGEHIPKESEGVIVHIYEQGKAYEVEFDDCKVVTVYHNEIKEV
jgi:hypothetical protein